MGGGDIGDNIGHDVKNAIQMYNRVLKNTCWETKSKDNKEISYFDMLRDDNKCVKSTILNGTKCINSIRLDCHHDPKYISSSIATFLSSPAGSASASYNGFLCTALLLQPSVLLPLKAPLHLLGVWTLLLSCLQFPCFLWTSFCPLTWTY